MNVGIATEWANRKQQCRYQIHSYIYNPENICDKTLPIARSIPNERGYMFRPRGVAIFKPFPKS